MRIVVDTNVLFSFFKKESITRSLIVSRQFDLISSEYALVELRKYKSLIKKKAKISGTEFERIIGELKNFVEFVNKRFYFDCINKVLDSCPDKKDVSFLALAFCKNSVLWSNDKILKGQDKVEVYSTSEIIEMFFGD